jgi:hypothetical protein
VSRHRSPRGRGAHQSTPSTATRRPEERRARHAVQPAVPLRRGAAAVAVAGGAFTLVGAAAPALPTVSSPQLLAATQAAFIGESPTFHADVEPVDPDPDVVDAAALVKAVQMAEQAVAKPKPTVQAATDCGLDESGLGPVKPYVRTAARLLGCRYDEPKMYGVAGRAGTSDHPSGKAVDFMVDRAEGDALASCALRNQDSLGITYVIWRQRINFGEGWQPMEDRGGVTANHFDHVHVSFGNRGGAGTLTGC